MQTRLAKQKVKYSEGSYNKSNKTEQWIRITEGCPNNCPFCYEPQEFKIFDIPEILRNQVKIMDMNLLAKPEALSIIRELTDLRADSKVVYYELICGIDYRFLTQEIADALYKGRFKNIRIAWDWLYKDQIKIKKGIDMLLKAGYKSIDIMIFMICNWKISYKENCKKLDLCKVWRVKVADCYYDNQVFPRVQPVHWTYEECKKFRKKSRKHNHLVIFGIDPQINKDGS